MTSSRPPLLEAETTKPIIEIFRDGHRTFGFGCREHIYRLAIERDLRRLGHLVEREVDVIVYYRGEPLVRQRLDIGRGQSRRRGNQSDRAAPSDRECSAIQLSMLDGLRGWSVASLRTQGRVPASDLREPSQKHDGAERERALQSCASSCLFLPVSEMWLSRGTLLLRGPFSYHEHLPLKRDFEVSTKSGQHHHRIVRVSPCPVRARP